MRISKIRIKGFRNFDDEEITFQDKTLIIGANDVGKTNLIYALRLLFDKSISERDLELSDSDYNAYSGTNQIEITVTITNVTEECIFYRKKGKKIFTEDSSESRKQEILFVDSVTTNNELIVTNLGKRNKDRNAFVFSWFRNNVMSLNYSDSFFENINMYLYI